MVKNKKRTGLDTLSCRVSGKVIGFLGFGYGVFFLDFLPKKLLNLLKELFIKSEFLLGFYGVFLF